ncbi:hypothetical protein [Streptomyces sp. UH6]|uniref:hypothetical protein n=1 Tax=Streptomyces sp. UH6 TaxID=2748379 RepID=UPI0015D4A079|nr:hypothetical protein [Streptomyces sp. UH6]NYV74027.1 hypothetical protein [Streptomyces sp. UH6]
MTEQTVDQSAQPEPTPAAQPVPEVPRQAGAPAAEAAVWTTPAAVEPPAKPKDRRALRAALRWTAAVVVFAAVGAGTAFGIASVERTELPGLATVTDGRWDYPELVRPPLPEGSPAPFDDDNPAHAHHADLRELLLPAPKGAQADKELAGDENGWLKRKTFLAEFGKDDREEIGQLLTDNGLRHIAARGWTMPDGTRTKIFLLHFNTAEQVDTGLRPSMAPYGAPGYYLDGTEKWVADKEFPSKAHTKGITSLEYLEEKPYGDEQSRQAYLMAGDTLAVITQTRKGTAPAVPFQQTVALQSQLLG